MVDSSVLYTVSQALSQALGKGAGLPRQLFCAQQMRDLDERAMAYGPVSAFELMQQAGRSAFRQALRRWPGTRHWLLVCGGGKNGGDGYIVAGHAAQQGISVRCLALADPQQLRNEARQAFEWAQANNVEVQPATPTALESGLAEADLVVDAMLGTGLAGDVRALYESAILAVNAAGRPVVAIDMPSGLCSDTGGILGSAVKADLTVTFIGLKLGLFTGHGPDVVGALVFDDLGCDPSIYDAVPAAAHRLDWATAKVSWPERRPTAHKGDFGRLLVIGGDLGMGGAALLTAEAAARAGAGMVFVATRPEHVPAFLAHRPELIVRPVAHRNDLVPILDQVDAVVIGPGLGQKAWGEQMFQAVRQDFKGPVLVDADGLNLLAASSSPVPANWVLTPHPGEASRLLGNKVPDISRDRVAAVNELCRRYGCSVLLKGAGTLIQRPGIQEPGIQEPGIQGAGIQRTGHAGNETAGPTVPTLIHGGNAGMATGGMGDVLSGFIGALLGYGMDPFAATVLGAALHGAAADVGAAELSMAGLLAGDLPLAAARLLATAETSAGNNAGESAGNSAEERADASAEWRGANG